jgi:hypothetical protein
MKSEGSTSTQFSILYFKSTKQARKVASLFKQQVKFQSDFKEVSLRKFLGNLFGKFYSYLGVFFSLAFGYNRNCIHS